jgi:hypothetical protein
VVLRDGTAGVPIQARPRDGESEAEAARTRQWREVGLGAQIFKDLGVRSIRLRRAASTLMWSSAGSASRSPRPRGGRGRHATPYGCAA